MPGEQRKRTYRLTDDCIAGLDRLATRNHTTVTSLIEAFGRLARDGYPTGDDVITLAHDIDRQRRSRR